MIHDLQILHALDGSPVREIRATGIPVLSNRTDIANVRIAFESGCVANLTASRVSAERDRKLRAFFNQRYYSLDYERQQIKGYRLDEAGGGREIVPDDLAVEKGEPLTSRARGLRGALPREIGPLADGSRDDARCRPRLDQRDIRQNSSAARRDASLAEDRRE